MPKDEVTPSIHIMCTSIVFQTNQSIRKNQFTLAYENLQ